MFRLFPTFSHFGYFHWAFFRMFALSASIWGVKPLAPVTCPEDLNMESLVSRPCQRVIVIVLSVLMILFSCFPSKVLVKVQMTYSSRGLMHHFAIKHTDFIAWSRKKEPKRLPELETRVHCKARFHVSCTKRPEDDEFREISNGLTPSAMHWVCEKKRRNQCTVVVQSWPWFLMIFALQLGHPRFSAHNSKWSAFNSAHVFQLHMNFDFETLLFFH